MGTPARNRPAGPARASWGRSKRRRPRSAQRPKGRRLVPVILHVIDEPISHLQALILVVVLVGGLDPPAQGDHYAGVVGRDDLGASVGDFQTWLEGRGSDAASEDFTSLVRSVSARCAPPPQMATLDAVRRFGDVESLPIVERLTNSDNHRVRERAIVAARSSDSSMKS